jgi:ParB family chromosome partitioning protein
MIDSPHHKHDVPRGAATVPISLIDPNPWQPRKEFSSTELSQLAESISSEGIIQPLVVSASHLNPGRFLLVAGERRLRAAQMLGLKEVPVVERVAEAHEQLSLALVENLQRADLNPIEEALAYKNLTEVFGYSVPECAKKVGKDRSTVSNAMRLLSLPEDIKQAVSEGAISGGHARALLSLRPDQVYGVFQEILKRQLNVRQTEELCRELSRSEDIPKPRKTLDRDFRYIEESLHAALRTRVVIKGKPNRGKIEIHFHSLSEFERLVEVVGREDGPS